jgi:bifunctional pyridoxal-dependent enzyme with beta-cystathionase and maltose regulon repressor activities
MSIRIFFAAGFLFGTVGMAVAEEDFKLPPQVTPALRAACEADVRRLCIGQKPTVSKVKSCVKSKFLQLGRRCQMQITLAGLKP